MSIFSMIKDAIFGQKAAAATPSAPSTGASAPRSAAPAAAPASIPASPTAAKWDAPVDVFHVLNELAEKNPQKLNWKTSIVDLMKLLGIDSSLQNRKELARELGYTGDPNDSAGMNIWLHKRVMQELEKNGGKVPASLTA
jgi:3-oxoacyl-ACP reductase-like protein